MSDFKNIIAKEFHNFVRLERDIFFEKHDDINWLPKYQADDAKIMCPPFVGENYKQGGLVIIPINPGGGNEKTNIRSDIGNLIYPSLYEFKDLNQNIENYYWEVFVPKFKEATIAYPIYKQMSDIFKYSETTLDDVAFFNFLPYRGKDNKYPIKKIEMDSIIPACIKYFVKPALDIIKPSLVVTFGTQVDIYIENYWKNFEYQKVSWNRSRAPTPFVIKQREATLIHLTNWAKSR